MFLKLIGFLPNRMPTPFEHPIITLTKNIPSNYFLWILLYVIENIIIKIIVLFAILKHIILICQFFITNCQNLGAI